MICTREFIMWDMVTKQTEWLVDGQKIYFTEGEKDANVIFLIHTDETPLFMSFDSAPAVTFFMEYSKGKVIQEVRVLPRE
jgi:hypothetical protein